MGLQNRTTCLLSVRDRSLERVERPLQMSATHQHSSTTARNWGVAVMESPHHLGSGSFRRGRVIQGDQELAE